MSDYVSKDDVLDALKAFYEKMGVDMLGVWNKQLVEIIKESDPDDVRLALRGLWNSIEELTPAEDLISTEQHVKELNALAVLWKDKFSTALKNTNKIFDETITKVAHERDECKEKLYAVAGRPTGAWIFNEGEYVCSHCRKRIFRVDGMKYCPNCGAKMENQNE